jgi:hypothetical protein
MLQAAERYIEQHLKITFRIWFLTLISLLIFNVFANYKRVRVL